MPDVLVPPNSKESEMMVLGCMLTNINSINYAADALHDSDFYYSEHKIVFGVMKELYKQDKSVDVHILCEELKRSEKLDSVGGVGYVTTLAQYAGTSAYIEEYVEIVKNKSTLRRMIHASQVIENKAFKDPDNVGNTLDEAQSLFFQIGQNALQKTGIQIKDVLSGVFADSKMPFLEELQKRQEEFLERGDEGPAISGIPTHFSDLDSLIHGFHNSNLMILAARPAMGKTALAINLAENFALKNNMPVGIFSLEMSAEQLVHRMVCSQAGVESGRIKTGSLNGEEFQRVVECVSHLQDRTILIDDQPGLKISELRARARRMKEAYNIGFLVIDYLQLISGSARAQESRQIEVSEISRLLKNLARELDIPILCLSQLSRKVEERTGHRPVMSDIRESGSIEQDSDLIFFLMRREYYDPNDKPGMAELIVAKNRHGAIGEVKLTFRKEVAQFANYSALNPSTSDPEADAAFASFAP